MSLCARWCLTLNNYPEDWLAPLKASDLVTYAVVGEEGLGEEGTPHLQGYIEFSKRMRITALKKWEITVWGTARAHWERTKATATENKVYCSKEKKFEEWGTPRRQGQRSDLRGLLEGVRSGKSFVELAEDHGSVHARYYKYCEEYGKRLTEEKERKRRILEAGAQVLHAWQRELRLHVLAQEDRKVCWVWEADGNVGKSFLGCYMGAVDSAFVVTGGKHGDIAEAYAMQELIVFDLTRTMEDKVPYKMMESYKDGNVFAPKYRSRMLLMPHCKVVVMANFEPDRSMLSEDRWCIHHVAGF